MRARATLGLLLSLAFVALASNARVAGVPIDLTGTSWSGPALLKAKIPSAPKLEGLVDLRFDFGPQEGLAADRFLLSLDDGFDTLDVAGSWSLDERGRLVLTIDSDTLEQELFDLMVGVCEDTGQDCSFLDELDVVFDPARLKLVPKVKVKDGLPSMTVKLSLPFALAFDGRVLVKVKLSGKASGVLLD